MCGIWGYISRIQMNDELFFKISHRGPDEYVLKKIKVNDLHICLGFHRLSIIDINNGMQPFIYENDGRKVYLLCNGEIYNYKNIIYHNKLNTTSDCHVILDLYLKYGIYNTINKLDGEFAFVIVDIYKNDISIYLARDRFGIRPLFYSFKANEYLEFSSELKGLKHPGKQIEPRQIYESNNIEFFNNSTYFTLNRGYTFINDEIIIQENIRNKLITSVKNRLETERPLGCLLSGGLDSSLIAGIASMLLEKEGKILTTFSIGMKNSPDLYYAKMVADHIKSNHYEIIIPEEEWIENIENVIKQIETFDITTIRASTGQYLLAKWISENTDIKVLLNGDGSDEICSGYLYFYNADKPYDSHLENIDLLNNIHYYDVLRVDRGISAHGLEARVPFLDHSFVTYYLSIEPYLRTPIKNKRMEKYLLRKSFEKLNIIPSEVLWRQKEAFSDGVSTINKSWYQIIEENVNDKNIDTSQLEKFQIIPHTKEALYYQFVFNNNYPNCEHIIGTNRYWMPKWSGEIHNPSARVLKVYNNNDN
jgi:asparagine synthase (glutamine-hydrolysing)